MSDHAADAGNEPAYAMLRAMGMGDEEAHRVLSSNTMTEEKMKTIVHMLTAESQSLFRRAFDGWKIRLRKAGNRRPKAAGGGPDVVLVANVSKVDSKVVSDDFQLLAELGTLPGPIKSLKASCRLRDQGVGNQKGAVVLRAYRGATVVREMDLFGVVPHEEVQAQRTWESSDLSFGESGDKISFHYRVGGGGGHEIHLRGFSAELVAQTGAERTVEKGGLFTKRLAAENVHQEGKDDEYRAWKGSRSEPLKAKLVSCTATCRWRDQGFGNMKGRIRLVLERGDQVMAAIDCFGLAGHHDSQPSVVLTDESLGVTTAPGDVLAFQYCIGGGGGHRLNIEDFSATVMMGDPASYPEYWRTHLSAVEPFHAMLRASVDFEDALRTLIADTFSADIATRDRKLLQKAAGMPRALEVVRAIRIESSGLWQAYQAKVGGIRAKRKVCTPITALEGTCGTVSYPPGGEVKTSMFLEECYLDRLDPSVNEFYLWHGSSPTAVYGISKTGFRIDLSGSHAGTMFGKGAYFCEASSKADEYAHEDDGLFAMLLCRVVCGEMLRLYRHEDCSLVEPARKADACDSVLGDREARVKTYREFIVPEATQVYPEYAVIYRRVFDEP